ncbi:MAG: isocitrate/isopropylmalate dehydrogenase family protein [Dehalococcoidales bacterium]|nr:MAG: isocitrate/isopropylmalate dehydrogenase family protein [Dehalococcoidales bacterium]
MIKKIAVLGGDGIGPEVVGAACYILEKANFIVEIQMLPNGEAALETHGTVLPEETKEQCEISDAVFFGSANPPSDPIIMYLRWGLGNYVNIRPTKYYTGAASPLKSPEGIDFVILRENSEGMYTYAEDDLTVLQEKLPDFRTRHGKSLNDYGKGNFALRIMSEIGMKRFAKYACEFAQSRKNKGYPGNITVVTKSNMFPQTCGMLEKAVQEELANYPELTYTRYYVDDMARRLVRFPGSFDVIATSNLFGDILTDEAAEIAGGLGMAGSACVGGKVPYFESVHGTAPDIAGKNIANPTGAILSAKYMLDYFGMDQEADSLEKALVAVYKEGKDLTTDQGGTASTTQFAEAVLRYIK